MAKEIVNNEIVEALSESIGSVLDRRKAATEKIPDVYASGMRGDELPPAQRKQKEAEEKAKRRLEMQKSGQRKGVNKAKAADSDEDDDEDGREVRFKAKGPTKKSLLSENKKLREQLAKLQGKKKVSI